MEGDGQSIPGSHLALPILVPSSALSLPQLPGRGLAVRWSLPAGSESKERWPGGSRGTECEGHNLAGWHVGTTGVRQTVEAASRSHSGEVHKGIGISIQ